MTLEQNIDLHFQFLTHIDFDNFQNTFIDFNNTFTQTELLLL